MTKTQWSRVITAGGAAMLACALVLGVMPGSAGAATVYTAQSSGRGLQLALAGAGIGDDQLAARVADTDRVPAPNGDGVADCVVAAPSQKCATGPTSASILALPFPHDIINANLVSQDAVVDNDGHSAACAGLVGPGGQIQLDDATKGCADSTLNPAVPGGIIINLATGIPLSLVRLRADAIVSDCTASAPADPADPTSKGVATGGTHLVNAVIETNTLLAGWQPILTLPGSVPTPNSPILFPAGPFDALNGLISITANEQSKSAAGDKVSVTALHLTLLGAIPGGGLLDVKIGQTSCGVNTAAIVADTTTTSSSSSTSTTGASSTSSTVAPSSTTSSSTPASSTTVEPSSTTSSSTPASSTTVEPSSTTSSTAEVSSTTSTEPEASTTSSTAGGATSSTTPTTIAGAGGSVTTKPAGTAPLANTGRNTRAELSLALGLLGLGFIVTGRGMQLGFASPTRRRR